MQEDSLNVKKEKLEKALIKKALGYDSVEVVEEYVTSEGEIKLNKKKVTTKNVPPDLTALKILLDGEKDIGEMTEEELENEKNRLLEILSERQKLLKPKRSKKSAK